MKAEENLNSHSTGENISISISIEHGASDTEVALVRNGEGDALRETQLNGDREAVSDGIIILGWRFYLIFASLAVASLAAALDATSLTVALPIITHDLHGTGIEAFWAGTSYLLTSTVVQPTFASLSHIFGRKPILLIALSFFSVGATISAASKRMAMLLVGRSFQGMGAGGVIALSEIVVTDLVELRLRGKWFGYLAIMWVFGSISGPVIGGAFAQKGEPAFFMDTEGMMC
ncbi:MAG: hypothetical protein M1827_007575 [Pycnora praestabilis]|nr:MAG: hypothetical protein M1827_007575 [Pycnora praestabilis]